MRVATIPTPDESLYEERWNAVLRRDASTDAAFVYAVTSTGIFCRPTCPSRRPRRDRVRFFDTPAAAASAGFRPCLRCRPTQASSLSRGDEAVVRATEYLRAHADERVTLALLARVASLSPFHLQRRFRAATGVSPREFQAACRAGHFRRALRAGADVTTAVYAAGYGSPSRAYEASPTGRDVSPRRYRQGGADLEVGYLTTETSIGWLLVASTANGVCAVTLGDSPAQLVDALRMELPRADIAANRHVRGDWVQEIVRVLDGGVLSTTLPLDVRGTAFQWRVWRALQAIPRGETRSYSEIAAAIAQPTAVRAVARACATNPVGLVIPCHRVVGKDGDVSGYRWGRERKVHLLTREKERKTVRP